MLFRLDFRIWHALISMSKIKDHDDSGQKERDVSSLPSENLHAICIYNSQHLKHTFSPVTIYLRHHLGRGWSSAFLSSCDPFYLLEIGNMISLEISVNTLIGSFGWHVILLTPNIM